MDGQAQPISSQQLYEHLGTASAPVLVDVRRQDAFGTDDRLITPQCEGLLAISYGLSANFPNDHEMLKHRMIMYDALYTWCRQKVMQHSSLKARA